MPLVAAFALLARLPVRGLLAWLASRGLAVTRGLAGSERLAASAEAAPGRLAARPRPRVPEWLAWHLMAVVGVALALGGNTPLGAVLAQLPLYGTQRLQSRNILVLDVALAVLLAYWADDPFPQRVRRLARRVPLDAALGALPAVAAVVLVAGAAGSAGLVRWLDGGGGPDAKIIGALWPWLIPFAVLGVAAVALVGAGRRLSRRAWRRLVTGFVVVDVLVFTALAVVQVATRPLPAATASASAAVSASAASASSGATGPGVPGTASAGSRAAASRAAAATVPHVTIRPIAALGYPGRFAIYDPGLQDTGQLSVLGPPDMNSLTRTPSVQGYTSLVDGRYAAATGSHLATGQGQNVLSAAAIGGRTLDLLNTTILLTLPVYADTDLRDVLVPPHWVLTGYDGSFAIYRNTRARGPLTLSALPGTTLPGATLAGASVSEVSGPAPGPTRAGVSSPAGVRVVRSVAAIPGWTATWRPLRAHGHAARASGRRRPGR